MTSRGADSVVPAGVARSGLRACGNGQWRATPALLADVVIARSPSRVSELSTGRGKSLRTLVLSKESSTRANFRHARFTNDSAHRLNHHSNFSNHHPPRDHKWLVVDRRAALGNGHRARTGEAEMARYEILEADKAMLAEANADIFFELGMMYSIGRSVPTDFVSAHKWFNLAALRGNKDAIRLRQEIAEQMSESDIAAAQRAARAWLKTH
jgi:hypothetical protein